MSNVIGHATLNIVPSTKGLGKSIQSSVTGASGKAGQAGGNAILGGMVGPLAKLAVGVTGALAGFMGLKAVIGGGIARQLQIEDAQAKLKGLGHSTEGIAAIMDSALASVRGTAYGLGDAAGLSAVAVAAGVKSGADLTRYLSLTADAATIAGTSLSEMGDVFGKVQSKGRAYTMDLNQLATRGIPIYQWLQQELGVTQEALQKMVAAGEIDSATYFAAIQKNIGGAALESGNTTRGAFANMRAAMSRLGEQLTQGWLPLAKGAFEGTTAAADVMSSHVKAVMGPVGVAVKAAMADAGGGFASVQAGLAAGLGALSEGLSGVFGGVSPQEIVASLRSRFAEALDSFAEWLGRGGLVDVFQSIAGARQGFTEAMFAALPGILVAFETIIPRLVELASSMIQQTAAFIAVQAPKLADAAVGLFSALVQGALAALPQIVAALVGLLPPLASALLSMVPQLLAAGVQLFTSLAQSIVAVLPSIITTIIGILPGLITTILGMIPVLLDAAIQLFTALVDAIPQIIPPLVVAVVDLLPQIAESLISMIPKLIEAAIRLFTAIVEALPKIIPPLNFATLDLLPSITKSLFSMIPALILGAYELFVGIVKALPKIVPDLINALRDLLPKMVETLFGMIPILAQAGVDLIGGLVQGLWSAYGAVLEALLGIIGGAVDGFLGFLGIKSPSRLFMGFGRHIGEGLAIGIRSMRGEVASATDDLASAASDVLAHKRASVSIHAPDPGSFQRPGDDGGDEPGTPGAAYVTNYYDHSTSQEDKTAKLSRAQDNLRASVAAGLWR